MELFEFGLNFFMLAGVWQIPVGVLMGAIVSSAVFLLLILRMKNQQKLKCINHLNAIKQVNADIINGASILFMMAVDGRIIEMNDKARECMDVKIGDGLEVFHASYPELVRILEKLKTTNKLDTTARLIFKDGVHRCGVSISNVNYYGKKAMVGYIVDEEFLESQKDQLLLSQQNLQTILDTLPVSVRIANRSTFEILYANSACLKMFGVSSMQKMEMKTVFDFLPEFQADGNNSHKKVETIMNTSNMSVSEIEYITAKGRHFFARTSLCDIVYNGVDAFVAIIVDRTNEIELQKTRINLQKIIDMTPLSIRIVDTKTKALLYANKTAETMFESPVYKKIGEFSYNFVAKVQRDGSSGEDMLKKIRPTSETPTTTDILLTTALGREFDARVTSCLIDYNGASASLGIVQDLSQEKEQQRLLESIAQREKEANLLKSRFLANMSHEIRTPMNVVIGLTEIELLKNNEGETAEIYKKINVSAKSLLAIINDILDISKIEENKFELHYEEFDLEEVVNNALLVASPRLDDKSVEFMLNSALDLPRFVIGDKTRVWQVLKNLLDNSAKYTNEGKIVLTVFADKAQPQNDQDITINFVIEDTGIGMSEEQVARMFLPYEQIYSDLQRKYSGTGLGLVISKHLCTLMGGELKVESRIGAGTIMHVRVPFKRSKSEKNRIAVMLSGVLKDKTVLAVDDDKLALDIMSGLLNSSSVKECVVAQSGEEALDIIVKARDKNKFFDLILLDYMMDGINGLETARKITVALSKAPKLLMVTAYQKMITKDELDKNGIYDIIEKPFIPSHFIGKICAVLGIDFDDGKRSASLTKFNDVSVLLCEDYKLNQEVACGMLSMFGIQTTIAENGKQGLEILESGKSFDLIFMDLQMPVMDGFETAKIIRSNHKYDHIPIICLTADAMKEAVERSLELGMNDHIAKPIVFENLNSALIKWLPESKRVEGQEVKVNLVDEVLARFGGDLEKYKTALYDFSDLLIDKWTDFDQIENEFDGLKKYVHKLKGASGIVGQKNIYALAVEFEQSLLNGNPDKDLYDALIGACKVFKDKIASMKASESDVALPKGSFEEFKEICVSLREALDSYNPKSTTETVQLLQKKVWQGVDMARVEKMIMLALKYDFDEALAVLDSIIQ